MARTRQGQNDEPQNEAVPAEERNEGMEVEEQPPQVPPQGGAPFALVPAQLNPDVPLDFSSSNDIKLYNKATQPINPDHLYDVDSAGLSRFMRSVRNRAVEQGWTNPQYGVCSIKVWRGNVQESYDLTTQYGCVTLDEVYANDIQFIGLPTRKAQNSMMLYKMVYESLSQVGKDKVNSGEHAEKMVINDVNSGKVLLKLITMRAVPATPASIQTIRNSIASMSEKMSEFGQDIAKFNSYVNELMISLAAYGHKYKNIEYHLFEVPSLHFILI